MTTIGVIIAFVKRSEITDPMLASHIRWQINTYIYTLVWAIPSLILCLLLIGYVLLLVVFAWHLYRLIKGFLRFSENRPMYS